VIFVFGLSPKKMFSRTKMTSSPPTNTELFSEDLALHLVPRSGHTHEPPTPVLVNFRVVQAKSSRVRAAFPPFAFLSLSLAHPPSEIPPSTAPPWNSNTDLWRL